MITCGDCRKNDYVARSYYDTQTHFALDQEQVLRLAGHRLQLANTLQMQACDASHWLICNPVEAGNIVVIDDEALTLLGNFRVPTPLQEIIVTKKIVQLNISYALLLIFINLAFFIRSRPRTSGI